MGGSVRIGLWIQAVSGDGGRSGTQNGLRTVTTLLRNAYPLRRHCICLVQTAVYTSKPSSACLGCIMYCYAACEMGKSRICFAFVEQSSGKS